MKRVTVEMLFCGGSNPSGIQLGVLKLPEEFSVNGDLIAFGENDDYLHCVESKTGGYRGIFKSDLPYHLYKSLQRLNPIDALKAQNAELRRRLNGRNGWVGTQEPNCSEEKCLYDQQGGDLEDELALS